MTSSRETVKNTTAGSRPRAAWSWILAAGLVFLLTAPLACVHPGPRTAIPAPPEQRAMLREIGQSYDNKGLRDEVLAAMGQASRKSLEIQIACIPGEIWDVNNVGAAIKKGAFGSKDVEPQIRSCFNQAAEFAQGLDVSYARFQDFRRKIAKVPHDVLLQRIGVMQGVVAMYYGRTLIDYLDAIEAKGCSLEPLRKFKKGAQSLMSNLVDGQMPAMVRQLEQSLPKSDMAILGLEVAVLAGKDVAQTCTTLVAELAAQSDPNETSALAWCGYAEFIKGNGEKAQQLWARAGQSVHSPDAASYALSMLRALEDGQPGAAATITLDKE